MCIRGQRSPSPLHLRGLWCHHQCPLRLDGCHLHLTGLPLQPSHAQTQRKPPGLGHTGLQTLLRASSYLCYSAVRRFPLAGCPTNGSDDLPHSETSMITLALHYRLDASVHFATLLLKTDPIKQLLFRSGSRYLTLPTIKHSGVL